jgi:hypothetical protein
MEVGAWRWGVYRDGGITLGVKATVQRYFCFRFFFSFATAISANLGKDLTNGVVDTGGNFAAGFNDAGGQFAGGVVNTGGAAWAANIFTNFLKIFNGA